MDSLREKLKPGRLALFETYWLRQEASPGSHNGKKIEDRLASAAYLGVIGKYGQAEVIETSGNGIVICTRSNALLMGGGKPGFFISAEDTTRVRLEEYVSGADFAIKRLGAEIDAKRRCNGANGGLKIREDLLDAGLAENRPVLDVVQIRVYFGDDAQPLHELAQKTGSVYKSYRIYAKLGLQVPLLLAERLNAELERDVVVLCRAVLNAEETKQPISEAALSKFNDIKGSSVADFVSAVRLTSGLTRLPSGIGIELTPFLKHFETLAKLNARSPQAKARALS